MRRIRVGLLSWSLAACSNMPERLELDRDTVSLYGGEYTWVPVRITRSSGAGAADNIVFLPRDQTLVRTSGNAVFDGMVTLTAGEARRWSLGQGRFTISVQPDSRDDLSQLSMETEGLNCARDSRDGDMIHCVGSIGAEAVLVRRTGLDAVGMGRAHVRILQIS